LVRDVGCGGLRVRPLTKATKVIRDGDQVYQIDPKTGDRIGKGDVHDGGWIVSVQPEPTIETLDDARKAVRALRYI
jgi:hypothetical protein